MPKPIDLVYTWVDDSFAGYLQQRDAYAQTAQDKNPNRTRDNLQMLKFSLRSIEPLLDWIGTIYIVSCRPQVPDWLDTGHPRIKLVHHDEFMPPEVLPTFNSFAIVSCLHLIPGLSDTFIYFEDDFLVRHPFGKELFFSREGKLRFFTGSTYSQRACDAADTRLSPWNQALANANAILDRAFVAQRRLRVEHMPIMIEKQSWQAMQEDFAQVFAQTRNSRFRRGDNVPPEYFYPYYLYYTGRAVLQSPNRGRQQKCYYGLRNSALLNRLALFWLGLKKVSMMTLNDNFEDNPSDKAVQVVTSWLHKQYPATSVFELPL